jgi:hypothetical protein
MISPRKLPLLLAVAALLAACSSNPQWVKPGTSKDTVRDDFDDCRAYANSATRQDAAIDQDILASRGTDWQHTNTLQAKKSTISMQDQGHVRDIIANCMTAKGYTPGHGS